MQSEKICATCGRPFAWRKAWADNWDEIRYCSKGCRSHRPNRVDRELEASLLAALESRREVPTDDAARAVGGDDWKALVERSRRAARRLAVEQRVELVQGGRRVGPNARGPLSVRAPQAS